VGILGAKYSAGKHTSSKDTGTNRRREIHYYSRGVMGGGEEGTANERVGRRGRAHHEENAKKRGRLRERTRPSRGENGTKWNHCRWGGMGESAMLGG